MMLPGEFDIIERYFAPLSPPSSFGLKDDTGFIDLHEAKKLVVTHDTILQGIHFLPGDPPFTIAQKALRVNLSDVFAKGAAPIGYTLSMGVPDGWGLEEIRDFADGLAKDQSSFNLFLVGGDTYRSPERLCIGICMFAKTDEGRHVSRLKARPGEIVMVTGTIGDGALGLDVSGGWLKLGADDENWLRQRYLVPNPLPAHASLVREFATAAMDVSDGLLGDLKKLCAASRVSARVERNKVPLSTAARSAIASDEVWWQRVLNGGDDYQVLFTLSEDRLDPCCEAAEHMGTSVTVIGRIDDGPAGDTTLEVDGKAVDVDTASYSHF